MPWAASPSAEEPQRLERSRLEEVLGIEPELRSQPSVNVVGLGAVCDLTLQNNDDPRSMSCKVGEFVTLHDSRRVLLHAERGWSSHTNTNDVWAHESVERMQMSALTVVLPDDAEMTSEDHDWQWLAELAHAVGIDTSADQLRALPYEVVLSARVRERLPERAGRDASGHDRRRG